MMSGQTGKVAVSLIDQTGKVAVFRSIYRLLYRRCKQIDGNPAARCLLLAPPQKLYLPAQAKPVACQDHGVIGEMLQRSNTGAEFWWPEIQYIEEKKSRLDTITSVASKSSGSTSLVKNLRLVKQDLAEIFYSDSTTTNSTVMSSRCTSTTTVDRRLSDNNRRLSDNDRRLSDNDRRLSELLSHPRNKEETIFAVARNLQYILDTVDVSAMRSALNRKNSPSMIRTVKPIESSQTDEVFDKLKAETAMRKAGNSSSNSGGASSGSPSTNLASPSESGIEALSVEITEDTVSISPQTVKLTGPKPLYDSITLLEISPVAEAAAVEEDDVRSNGPDGGIEKMPPSKPDAPPTPKEQIVASESSTEMGSTVTKVSDSAAGSTSSADSVGYTSDSAPLRAAAEATETSQSKSSKMKINSDVDVRESAPPSTGSLSVESAETTTFNTGEEALETPTSSVSEAAATQKSEEFVVPVTADASSTADSADTAAAKDSAISSPSTAASTDSPTCTALSLEVQEPSPEEVEEQRKRDMNNYLDKIGVPTQKELDALDEFIKNNKAKKSPPREQLDGAIEVRDGVIEVTPVATKDGVKVSPGISHMDEICVGATSLASSSSTNESEEWTEAEVNAILDSKGIEMCPKAKKKREEEAKKNSVTQDFANPPSSIASSGTSGRIAASGKKSTKNDGSQQVSFQESNKLKSQEKAPKSTTPGGTQEGSLLKRTKMRIPIDSDSRKKTARRKNRFPRSGVFGGARRMPDKRISDSFFKYEMIPIPWKESWNQFDTAFTKRRPLNFRRSQSDMEARDNIQKLKEILRAKVKQNEAKKREEVGKDSQVSTSNEISKCDSKNPAEELEDTKESINKALDEATKLLKEAKLSKKSLGKILSGQMKSKRMSSEMTTKNLVEPVPETGKSTPTATQNNDALKDPSDATSTLKASSESSILGEESSKLHESISSEPAKTNETSDSASSKTNESSASSSPILAAKTRKPFIEKKQEANSFRKKRQAEFMALLLHEAQLEQMRRVDAVMADAFHDLELDDLPLDGLTLEDLRNLERASKVDLDELGLNLEDPRVVDALLFGTEDHDDPALEAALEVAERDAINQLLDSDELLESDFVNEDQDLADHLLEFDLDHHDGHHDDGDFGPHFNDLEEVDNYIQDYLDESLERSITADEHLTEVDNIGVPMGRITPLGSSPNSKKKSSKSTASSSLNSLSSLSDEGNLSELSLTENMSKEEVNLFLDSRESINFSQRWKNASGMKRSKSSSLRATSSYSNHPASRLKGMDPTLGRLKGIDKSRKELENRKKESSSNKVPAYEDAFTVTPAVTADTLKPEGSSKLLIKPTASEEVVTPESRATTPSSKSDTSKSTDAYPSRSDGLSPLEAIDIVKKQGLESSMQHSSEYVKPSEFNLDTSIAGSNLAEGREEIRTNLKKVEDIPVGSLLISHPVGVILQPTLHRSVILITGKNGDKGYSGIILNKPLMWNLMKLTEHANNSDAKTYNRAAQKPRRDSFKDSSSTRKMSIGARKSRHKDRSTSSTTFGAYHQYHQSRETIVDSKLLEIVSELQKYPLIRGGDCIHPDFPLGAQILHNLDDITGSKLLIESGGGIVSEDTMLLLDEDDDRIITEGKKNQIITEGKKNRLYINGNLDEIVQKLKQKKQNEETESDFEPLVKLVGGYCIWDKNQLETEIERNLWKLCQLENPDIKRAFFREYYYNACEEESDVVVPELSWNRIVSDLGYSQLPEIPLWTEEQDVQTFKRVGKIFDNHLLDYYVKGDN